MSPRIQPTNPAAVQQLRSRQRDFDLDKSGTISVAERDAVLAMIDRDGDSFITAHEASRAGDLLSPEVSPADAPRYAELIQRHDTLLNQLTGELQAARAKLQAADEALAADPQSPKLKAAATAARSSFTGVRDQAAAVGLLGGNVRKKEAALAILDLAKASTAQVEMTNAATTSPEFCKTVANLNKAQALRALVEEGKLSPSAVDLEKLDRDITTRSAIVQRQAAAVEQRAAAVVAQLQSPELRQRLALLPREEQAELLGRMAKAIAPSKVGQQYFETELLPALKAYSAGGKAAAGGPDPSPWASVLGGAGAAQGVVDNIALKLIEGTGCFLARRANGVAKATEGATVLQGALAQALALNPGQLEVFEEASLRAAAGETEAAKKLLDDSGLGRLTPKLELGGNAVVLVGTLLTAAAFFSNPDKEANAYAQLSKAAVEGLGATGSLLELMGKAPGLAKYLGVVGKIAPALDLVIGATALCGENGTMARGDKWGTVGQSLVMAGGLVAAVGVGASTTVVGAVGGVPLALIGTVIAGVGQVIDFVGGQSESTKWMHQNFPEYASDLTRRD